MITTSTIERLNFPLPRNGCHDLGCTGFDFGQYRVKMFARFSYRGIDCIRSRNVGQIYVGSEEQPSTSRDVRTISSLWKQDLDNLEIL